jgi:hypothetical protein
LLHPRDIHYVINYGKPLAYGFEHFVSVTPIVRILGAEIDTKNNVSYYIKNKILIEII